jgi:RHS repeat-associated protein
MVFHTGVASPAFMRAKRILTELASYLACASVPFLKCQWIPSKWRMGFVYDGWNRRRIKREYGWESGAWVLTNEVRYIYDGNLVVQERDENNIPNVTYTRGLDLSGSLEEAGGIGGLLARTDNRTINQDSLYYYADANGNVTALFNSKGTVVGKYGYEPFGNVSMIEGRAAERNTFRFSSKESDLLSGLSYYGQRYYAPEMQRWITRDPIGEVDSPNLYKFVHNTPANAIDAFGLFSFVDILGDLAADYGSSAVEAARGVTITSRVRDVVNTLNAIESFKDGYMTASDMIGIDGLDMLERLEQLRGEQAQGLKGTKTLSFAERQNHHIFPQAFRDIFKGVKNGKLNINAFAVRINEALHLKGLHGGGYNSLFSDFLKKNGKRIKKDPMFLVGFGFGVMNELGFGNYTVVAF